MTFFFALQRLKLAPFTAALLLPTQSPEAKKELVDDDDFEDDFLAFDLEQADDDKFPGPPIFGQFPPPQEETESPIRPPLLKRQRRDSPERTPTFVGCEDFQNALWDRSSFAPRSPEPPNGQLARLLPNLRLPPRLRAHCRSEACTWCMANAFQVWSTEVSVRGGERQDSVERGVAQSGDVSDGVLALVIVETRQESHRRRRRFEKARAHQLQARWHVPTGQELSKTAQVSKDSGQASSSGPCQPVRCVQFQKRSQRCSSAKFDVDVPSWSVWEVGEKRTDRLSSGRGFTDRSSEQWAGHVLRAWDHTFASVQHDCVGLWLVVSREVVRKRHPPSCGPSARSLAVWFPRTWFFKVETKDFRRRESQKVNDLQLLQPPRVSTNRKQSEELPKTLLQGTQWSRVQEVEREFSEKHKPSPHLVKVVLATLEPRNGHDDVVCVLEVVWTLCHVSTTEQPPDTWLEKRPRGRVSQGASPLQLPCWPCVVPRFPRKTTQAEEKATWSRIARELPPCKLPHCPRGTLWFSKKTALAEEEATRHSNGTRVARTALRAHCARELPPCGHHADHTARCGFPRKPPWLKSGPCGHVSRGASPLRLPNWSRGVLWSKKKVALAKEKATWSGNVGLENCTHRCHSHVGNSFALIAQSKGTELTLAVRGKTLLGGTVDEGSLGCLLTNFTRLRGRFGTRSPTSGSSRTQCTPPASMAKSNGHTMNWLPCPACTTAPLTKQCNTRSKTKHVDSDAHGNTPNTVGTTSPPPRCRKQHWHTDFQVVTSELAIATTANDLLVRSFCKATSNTQVGWCELDGFFQFSKRDNAHVRQCQSGRSADQLGVKSLQWSFLAWSDHGFNRLTLQPASLTTSWSPSVVGPQEFQGASRGNPASCSSRSEDSIVDDEPRLGRAWSRGVLPPTTGTGRLKHRGNLRADEVQGGLANWPRRTTPRKGARNTKRKHAEVAEVATAFGLVTSLARVNENEQSTAALESGSDRSRLFVTSDLFLAFVCPNELRVAPKGSTKGRKSSKNVRKNTATNEKCCRPKHFKLACKSNFHCLRILTEMEAFLRLRHGVLQHLAKCDRIHGFATTQPMEIWVNFVGIFHILSQHLCLQNIRNFKLSAPLRMPSLGLILMFLAAAGGSVHHMILSLPKSCSYAERNVLVSGISGHRTAPGPPLLVKMSWAKDDWGVTALDAPGGRDHVKDVNKGELSLISSKLAGLGTRQKAIELLTIKDSDLHKFKSIKAGEDGTAARRRGNEGRGVENFPRFVSSVPRNMLQMEESRGTNYNSRAENHASRDLAGLGRVAGFVEQKPQMMPPMGVYPVGAVPPFYYR
eukprot:jgi/Bigna1/79657/fgenesh1_pg.64_\